MSSKPETKTKTKAVLATTVKEEEVVLATIQPVKEEPVKEEPVKEEVVTESVKDEENLEEQIDDNRNEVEEVISAEEHLNLLKERTENTRRLIKAQKSISNHTKVELKEIQKEEKLLYKAEYQLIEERNKFLHSLASSSAPKPKKNNLDADGNKIPTPGKNPVVWHDFAKDAFALETNDGFLSKYLELIWIFIKSEEGVKEGASIIISKPGRVNSFFNNIKSIIENKESRTEKDNKIFALIEKGVLKNTDITSFSTYCHEEKEKKVKVTKKATAKAEAK